MGHEMIAIYGDHGIWLNSSRIPARDSLYGGECARLPTSAGSEWHRPCWIGEAANSLAALKFGWAKLGTIEHERNF